jgi:hypothetical protein
MRPSLALERKRSAIREAVTRFPVANDVRTPAELSPRVRAQVLAEAERV